VYLFGSSSSSDLTVLSLALLHAEQLVL